MPLTSHRWRGAQRRVGAQAPSAAPRDRTPGSRDAPRVALSRRGLSEVPGREAKPGTSSAAAGSPAWCAARPRQARRRED